ncbi:MAG TPA: hypothetical protein VHX19_20385 [Stellaceae bacterium]|jgi:hypothetical protein|nr:hypothetical protein [Stellaceae bacterium]
MPGKFPRGSIAYTQNGRRYTVEDVADGTVYCVGDNGAETEFAESALMTETEWAARSEKRAGNVYDRIKRGRLYNAPALTSQGAKLDRAAATTVLGRVDKLSPGILDFVAFTVAGRILAEANEAHLAEGLSISKCRAVFDAAALETRTGLLASILATPPDVLLNAARLGDNLMRALIEKGMAAQADAFDEFCDRPRS